MRYQYRNKKHGFDQPEYMTGVICHFENSADMQRHMLTGTKAETGKNIKVYDKGYNGREWLGECTFNQAMEWGVVGNDKHLAKVMHVMNEVEATLGETTSKTWRRRPAGMFPSVPDAIMDKPDSMWRKEDENSDRAPITIWVNSVSSGGWGENELSKRGAAIAALLLKLAQFRPVKLNLLMMVGQSQKARNYCNVVPVESAPLNVSQLAHILCNPGWHRHQYPIASNGWDSDLSWDSIFIKHNHDPNKPEFVADMKTFLDMAPQDLYVPQAYLMDEMVRDPVAWVKRTLAMYEIETGAAS